MLSFATEFFGNFKAEKLIMIAPSDSLPTSFDTVMNGIGYIAETELLLMDDCCIEEVLSYLDEHTRTTLYLFDESDMSNELCVRLSARKQGSSLLSVIRASVENTNNTFSDEVRIIAERKIYMSHIMGKYILSSPPFMISISREYEAKKECCSAETAPVKPFKKISLNKEKKNSSQDIKTLSVEKVTSFIGEADHLVVCGLGIKNKENAEKASALAAKLGAECAATRSAVMNGLFPLARLVGVSGLMLSPKISILLGASGAPAFYAGIAKSDKIIAINIDPEAPIMKKADLAICGEAMTIFKLFSDLTDT